MDALSAFAPGATVALLNKATYTLARRLGAGAEGVVFLAHPSGCSAESLAAPAPVALKFLTPRPAPECDSHAHSIASRALSGALGPR